jgi:hypothetical protein
MMTRGEKIGKDMAKGILGMLHLMYNQQTAKRVCAAIIKCLTVGLKEFE